MITFFYFLQNISSDYFWQFQVSSRNFIKKEAPARMFFCEFCKIFKDIFRQNTFGWMFLVFICEFWKVFQNTFSIEHFWETTYLMYKLQNFNDQTQ